jgi:hypothetical protein
LDSFRWRMDSNELNPNLRSIQIDRQGCLGGF